MGLVDLSISCIILLYNFWGGKCYEGKLVGPTRVNDSGIFVTVSLVTWKVSLRTGQCVSQMLKVFSGHVRVLIFFDETIASKAVIELRKGTKLIS